MTADVPVPGSETYVVREAAIFTQGQRRNANSLYTILVGAQRRLTRQLDGMAELRYRYQNRERDAGNTKNTHVVLIVLRLSLTLDPYRF